MKIFKIFLALVLFSNCAYADVIYSPYTSRMIMLSLEATGSYEFVFSRSNTVNLWGGIGAVSAINEIRYPALGGEAAIELRQYFNKGNYSGFNIGFYTGLAYMRYPEFYNDRLVHRENSIGIVPGLKLTYKHRINSWLAGEPYIGISTPVYARAFSDIFDRSGNQSTFFFTVGVRIGFNRVRTDS